MKPVLIVENNTNPLSINESVELGKTKEYTMGGIFTEFDVLNRNQRVYTSPKFLPCLDEMNERINTMGVVYGEFDHPDVFDTSLSRASHTITKAHFVKEHNRVDGEIRLLSTYFGREARSLVDDGCPIFVSSRAAGITESDGSVSLKKLFTYDIVADPGFGSAKMSSINESLGFQDDKTNFRIYDMSNESKTNELFNMNQNDLVTKDQLSEYSNYIIKEIENTRMMVSKSIKEGKDSPSEVSKLLEYYDGLNTTNTQIVKYLDYLASSVQIMVNENKSLKETTSKLIKHNDYLAENIEKTVNYTEYLAENLDKTISYSEYIVENLDKTISYTEYLAENLDRNISYGEYLAENLDKNISYSEYLAENVDNNIAYSEYLAENVDNNIAYSEYIVETLEGTIAYTEYIAENLDSSISYVDYIAESLDKNVSYTAMIAEGLNGGAVNESTKVSANKFPTPKDAGFSQYDIIVESAIDVEVEDKDECGDMSPISAMPMSEDTISIVDDENCVGDECEVSSVTSVDETLSTGSESDLSKQINKLILETTKRKVSETTDLHFLKFLNKSQIDSYNTLATEEQEQVKLYINEKSYFTSQDVLRLIQEALSVTTESLEDKLIRLMPDDKRASWEGLNESSKKSILSQGRLYSSLDTESKVEHFWSTRQFKTNESNNKKLLSHDSIIQEDSLSDSEVAMIMERFKNV
jgi:hypothetical protein